MFDEAGGIEGFLEFLKVIFFFLLILIFDGFLSFLKWIIPYNLSFFKEVFFIFIKLFFKNVSDLIFNWFFLELFENISIDFVWQIIIFFNILIWKSSFKFQIFPKGNSGNSLILNFFFQFLDFVFCIIEMIIFCVLDNIVQDIFFIIGFKWQDHIFLHIIHDFNELLRLEHFLFFFKILFF